MVQDLAVIAIDGGELSLGGGLLALIRPSLNALEPEGMLAVVSRRRGRATNLLGGGLLALIRPPLNALEPEGMLAVVSRSKGLRHDLPSWCRSERHEYLGCEQLAEGTDRHLIMRSKFSSAIKPSPHEQLINSSQDTLTAAEMLRQSPMPAAADPSTGF